MAYLASNAVPLRDENRPALAGFTMRPDFRRRLRVLCDAYGLFSPVEVIDAVFEVVQRQLERTLDLGAQSIELWATFLAHGQGAGFRTELAWLQANQDALL